MPRTHDPQSNAAPECCSCWAALLQRIRMLDTGPMLHCCIARQSRLLRSPIIHPGWVWLSGCCQGDFCPCSCSCLHCYWGELWRVARSKQLPHCDLRFCINLFLHVLTIFQAKCLSFDSASLVRPTSATLSAAQSRLVGSISCCPRVAQESEGPSWNSQHDKMIALVSIAQCCALFWSLGGCREAWPKAVQRWSQKAHKQSSKSKYLEVFGTFWDLFAFCWCFAVGFEELLDFIDAMAAVLAPVTAVGHAPLRSEVGLAPQRREKQTASSWETDLDLRTWRELLHFEWSPPWHHIITYLSQILTFFVLKSGEDEKERIILMKSRALRSLDFITIILSSSSLLLLGGPAVTTVIYLAKLRNNFRRLGVSRRLGAWELRFERYKTVWLS